MNPVLPNADDPRDGTPMNTDDELRQRAITALKSSVMSFTDYGAKQIWEALAPIIVTDRCKSNLQRAIDEIRNMPHQYDPDLKMHTLSNNKIPTPIECRCYKGRRLKALQAELHQVEGGEK